MLRQKNYREFEDRLDYTVGYRSVWDTVSRQNKMKQNRPQTLKYLCVLLSLNLPQGMCRGGHVCTMVRRMAQDSEPH